MTFVFLFLERKLERLTKKNNRGPTSHDIINSLASFHEDQMRRFIDADKSEDQDIPIDSAPMSASFVQRKLYPAQPVNGEELQSLVKQDSMVKEESKTDSEIEKQLQSGVVASNSVDIHVTVKDNPSEEIISERNVIGIPEEGWAKFD